MTGASPVVTRIRASISSLLATERRQLALN